MTGLDYKSPTFKEDLDKATRQGVDLFYDNIGGEILDLMLARMSKGGRITACGAISGYNSDNPCALKNYFHVISMRLQIRGFIVLDYPQEQAMRTQNLLRKAIEDGTLSIGEDNHTVVTCSFEDIPKTWLRLFSGQNVGKLVSKVLP